MGYVVLGVECMLMRMGSELHCGWLDVESFAVCIVGMGVSQNV